MRILFPYKKPIVCPRRISWLTELTFCIKSAILALMNSSWSSLISKWSGFQRFAKALSVTPRLEQHLSERWQCECQGWVIIRWQGWLTLSSRVPTWLEDGRVNVRAGCHLDVRAGWHLDVRQWRTGTFCGTQQSTHLDERWQSECQG